MDTQALWREFLALVREEKGNALVETWFQAMSLREWDHLLQIAYLNVPNSFVKEWVETRYAELVESALGRVLQQKKIKVIFVTAQQKSSESGHKPTLPAPPVQLIPAVKAPLAPSRPAVDKKAATTLQMNYNFNSFVVGPHNSLAFAAAHAVVDKLGVLYNPFFIYGKSGLGKTHLLHAIGNAVKDRAQGVRVLYQSANRFVTDFISSIRFDRTHHFEARYKDIDLLLMDDVQCLANKEQTQEAFFHLLNTMHNAHRQIVCTSDSLPGDIAGFADRVRSRLVSGLVTDISAPTLETKIAIIKKKSDAHGVYLSPEVAEAIARSEGANVRDIEGALIRVLAYAELQNKPLTLACVKEALCQGGKKSHLNKQIGLQLIATSVARELNCPLEHLLSGKREKHIAQARHLAMYLMKRLTNKSLREIGFYLQKKDHSTVLYAINKVEEIQKQNPHLKQLIDYIEQQLVL